MQHNYKILIISTLIFFLFIYTPAHSQISRITFEAGYISNNWEDATNFEKLETKKSSSFVMTLNAPIVEVIENRLYFGTGLKLAKRGSEIKGPFYEELELDYLHEVSYTTFDIPIFYEFRYPIMKYRYRYSDLLDKLAVTAKLGTNFSFLASSNAYVYKNENQVYSGKAIRNYSPRINDLLHHIFMSISTEYYFTDNYGVSLTFAHERSRALTKTLNHPVFNKSIEYQPANARFYEKTIMITVGGIYRFIK